jgi:hypothetical protein
MIECTDLFVDTEWACAHIMGDDMARINVQPRGSNRIFTVHIRISKIANFLEQLRRAQHVSKDTSDSKAF